MSAIDPEAGEKWRVDDNVNPGMSALDQWKAKNNFVEQVQCLSDNFTPLHDIWIHVKQLSELPDNQPLDRGPYFCWALKKKKIMKKNRNIVCGMWLILLVGMGEGYEQTIFHFNFW